MNELPPGGVLVSDFDGTLCRNDFFQLVVESLLPADAPDYWGDYLAGRRTHFETLQVIFGSIRADEATLLGLVGGMDLFSDAAAARLVPPGVRFARANLAAVLRAEGLPFRPFERWSEVAAALVG